MSKEKYTRKDLCDMKITHFVYKAADINKIRDPRVLKALVYVEEEYEKIRIAEGKNPCPTYIVINTDEPYINEIIDVLKKHNHWDL